MSQALNEKNRKLIRSGAGKSYFVNIPMDFVRALDWRAKQKVTVRLEGDKLIIEDFKS